ncbi:hypothetical protein LX70_04039 [Defluviimonas denitrificans]|jgi:hypothetical protein|uniref:Uncharacterized protein n=1 Tax=Albidovulum denitrificans TaxID=404881 RepID=A0A2S8RWH9_9RHOB|nr:hypothetical protein LX70_04039 [Defluviimonas denitrificans]
MVSVGMSEQADILTDDPIALKAMIATLQAENARMSATLQARPHRPERAYLYILRNVCGTAQVLGARRYIMTFSAVNL